MSRLDFLAQTSTLERWEALQRGFNRSGAVAEALLLLCVVAAMLSVVLFVYTRYKRRHALDFNDPRKLYRTILQKLDLSVPQRDLLRRMASDLELAHPTSLLLGRSVFESYAGRWLETGRHTHHADADRVGELADRLFP